MKLALLCLVGGAVAVAPPVIELNLSNLAQKLDTSIHRAHNDNLKQTNGVNVDSRQDWSQRCPAGPGQKPATCPFPVATAYDHHDQRAVDVQERVYKVDLNGSPCINDVANVCGCTNDQCLVTNVDMSQRSTYLFKYDATDRSGNHAEQVVFSLVLDDRVKPQLNMCGATAEVWQAGKDATNLCLGTTASDNIDGEVVMNKQVRYDVIQVDADGDQVPLCENKDYSDYVTFMGGDRTGSAPCAYSELKTSRVGRFIVVFKVCDLAGVYGVNSESNCVEEPKAVWIKDDLGPVIDLIGEEPAWVECSSTLAYEDKGAHVTDELDTQKKNLDISKSCESLDLYGADRKGCLEMDTKGAPVERNTIGDYEVYFNAWDTHGNPAQNQDQKRDVKVRDNVAPTATLVGDTQIFHYVNKTVRTDPSVAPVLDDAEATCADDCDTDPQLSMSWQDGKALDDHVVGDYVRIYTCTDKATPTAHTHSVTRTFTVIDNSVPIITREGDESITIDASMEDDYEDDGAECHDYVDGDLSHAVQVGGDIVNRRIPGTYTIVYSCQDRKGHDAVEVERHVTVEDTKCPEVELNCRDDEGALQTPCATTPDSIVHLEAGFPYHDLGATAFDKLCDTDTTKIDLTNKITTDGDQVDNKRAFHKAQSCKDIKDEFPGATTGTYFITSFFENKYNRIEVYCDMSGSLSNTFKACRSCAPVVPYASDQGDCGKFGMSMADWTSAGLADSRAMLKARFPLVESDSVLGADSDYWCFTTSSETLDPVTAHADPEKWGAEAGTYVIAYHVRDAAGNDECTTPKRTVIVRDTLPPVISLHLSNELIHTSAGGASSEATGEKENPAAVQGTALVPSTNPHLNLGFEPAEQPQDTAPWQGRRLQEVTQASNAFWAAGALAVAGLALVAVRKPQAAVVEV